MNPESFTPRENLSTNLDSATSVPELRQLIRTMIKNNEHFQTSDGRQIDARAMLDVVDSAIDVMRREFDKSSRTGKENMLESYLAGKGVTRDRGLRAALVRLLSSPVDVLEIGSPQR